MNRETATKEELEKYEAGLLREFEDVIVKESMRLKTLGVDAPPRAWTMMTIALACLDFWWQEQEGQTLSEEMFAGVARQVHQRIRATMAKGAS